MSEDEEIQTPPASIEIGTLPFTGEAAPEMDMTSGFETEVETDV